MSRRDHRAVRALMCAAGLLCAPADLPGQQGTPPHVTTPPDARLYFEASGAAPFLAPLLELHGCSVPEGRNVRVELPGRIFEPPVELKPDASAGRADPIAAISTQWAALEAGEAERAVEGWVPEERALAASLLADSSAIERYRAEAAAIDSASVDAIVWFDDAQGRWVAGLLSTGGLMAWTLGMPNGFRHVPGEGFLMTIGIARDPRFAVVGAAVVDGTFGAARKGESSEAATLPEVCGTEEEVPGEGP